MLQLPILLTPSSDLPVATALPALPRIQPPRQGLQAVQVGTDRVAYLAIQLVPTTHCPPSTHPSAVHRPRRGPCRVPRGAQAASVQSRRRRRRRQGETAPDINMGAPAGNARGRARCFLEPDQLAEALCEGAGPPAWVASVDPMQDELAAALVAIRQAAHQRLGACRLRQPPLRRFKLRWWRLVLRRRLLGA